MTRIPLSWIHLDVHWNFFYDLHRNFPYDLNHSFLRLNHWYFLELNALYYLYTSTRAERAIDGLTLVMLT